MIHPLARKHYFSVKRYPMEMKEYDRSTHYLNLNINSESDTPYKWYPPFKNNRLAESCLQMLCQLSGTMRSSSQLTAENVLISQGSSEAIDLIIRAFCEPKEEAVTVTNPTFFYYSYRAKIENVSVFDIPLQGEHLNVLDTEQILAHPTKVLFLCTPNNPVGTVLDPQKVELLIRRYPGIVVLDEAYIDWTEMPSFMGWPEKYENLLVLRTFSKIWGLAGVRCGITIGAKSAIETLSTAQTMFSFPNSSTEIILDKVRDVESILHYRSRMKQLRSECLSFFKELKSVEKVYPGEANFLFVQFHDQRKVREELLKEKILVADTAFIFPRSLRISIGLREEIEKLKRVLKQLE
jgi:histidinol-phosphate aminotransferase